MSSKKQNITLLEPENSGEIEDLEIEDIKKLIQEASVSQQLSEETQEVVPKHGFCVKTKDDSKNKIFINFCHCPELPSPEVLTEEALKSILQSDDPSNYRIPMSIGEPHSEKDRGGDPCIAYDIIISSSFYGRINDSELFKVFLVTVGIQALEDKYSITIIKDDWTVLKNKRYHGAMPKHYIRKAPKITEISGDPISATGKISTQEHKEPPDWVLRRPITNSTGQGGFLEARFLLDKLDVGNLQDESFKLEINEERLVLSASASYSTVDVTLPAKIRTQDCKARYRKHSKVLHVMMPIHEPRLVLL